MSQTKLIRDLDSACLKYLIVRTEFLIKKRDGERLEEIDLLRTRSHDAVIACFNAFLRAQGEDREDDMVRAAGNRISIGKWAVKRALHLLLQSR